MSGGSLDYFYGRLEEHVGDFDDKELDELVKDLAQLFYAREWYLSGDTGLGDWREARDNFKQKWFGADRMERFERYLQEAVNDLRESIGLNAHKKCETCEFWKPESGMENRYGCCKFEKFGMTEKCYVCEKWSAKNDEGRKEEEAV